MKDLLLFRVKNVSLKKSEFHPNKSEISLYQEWNFINKSEISPISLFQEWKFHSF